MSRVSDIIAFRLYKQGETKFFIPASEIRDEDKYLIELGILRAKDGFVDSVMCPFNCGNVEEVHHTLNQKGEAVHFIVCSEGNGEIELSQNDLGLYEFDSAAYLKYNTHGSLPKHTNQRIKLRPRNTKWIKTERQAVIEYANDPKRNKAKRLPHELCDIVWRINEVEFVAASKLPKSQRGYKNATALRAYFYQLHQQEENRKSLALIEDS